MGSVVSRSSQGAHRTGTGEQRQGKDSRGRGRAEGSDSCHRSSREHTELLQVSRGRGKSRRGRGEGRRRKVAPGAQGSRQSL